MTGWHQFILFGKFLIPSSSLDQLIEHVVISLAGALKCYATLLEQIILDDASLDHPLAIKAYLHKLAKSRAIIIPHCLRVSYFKNKYKNI